MLGSTCSRWRKSDNFFLDIIALNVNIDEPMFRTVLNKLDLARRAGFEEFHILSLMRNCIPEHEVSIPLRRHPDALMILWESYRPLYDAQLPLCHYVRRLNYSIPTLLYANVEAHEQLCKTPEYANVIKHGVLEFGASMFRSSRIGEDMYRITLSHNAKLKPKTFKRALTWMSHEAHRRHKARLRPNALECVQQDAASVEDEMQTPNGNVDGNSADTFDDDEPHADDAGKFQPNNAHKTVQNVVCDVPKILLRRSSTAVVDIDGNDDEAGANGPIGVQKAKEKIIKKIKVKQVQLLSPQEAARNTVIPLRESLSADDKSRVSAVQKSATAVRQIVNAVRMANSVVAAEHGGGADANDDDDQSVNAAPVSLLEAYSVEDMMQTIATDLLDAEHVLGKRVQWYFNIQQQQASPALRASSSAASSITTRTGQQQQQNTSNTPHRSSDASRASTLLNATHSDTAASIQRNSNSNLYRHQQQQRTSGGSVEKLVKEIYSYPMIDDCTEFKFTYRLQRPLPPPIVMKIFQRIREYKEAKQTV